MKVTERLVDAVAKLVEDGYGGDIMLTNSYPTGVEALLGNSFSLKLSGFCKESLFVIDDSYSDKFELIGRYSHERDVYPEENFTEVLTSVAWSFYKAYKPSGYSMPYEWEGLFKRYGYITTRQKTITEVVEKD